MNGSFLAEKECDDACPLIVYRHVFDLNGRIMKIDLFRTGVEGRWYSVAAFILIGLALLMMAFGWSSQKELTCEELLEKSHEACLRLLLFEVVFSAIVELSGSDPGKRTLRYRLGKDHQVLIEIGTLMRMVAKKNKIFIESKSAAGRYLELPYEGDLADASAAARGSSILAGLWEPPQAPKCLF